MQNTRKVHQERWRLLEEPLVRHLHQFRASSPFVQEIIIVHVMLRIFFVHVHASGQNVSNSQILANKRLEMRRKKVAMGTMMRTNYHNSGPSLSFW